MTDKEFSQYLPVLQEIQQKAREKFGDKLFKEVPADEDIVKVMKEASQLPGIPKWKKDYYEVMAKEMDTTQTVLDEDVQKEYDAYLDNEFKKAKEDGRLPK